MPIFDNLAARRAARAAAQTDATRSSGANIADLVASGQIAPPAAAPAAASGPPPGGIDVFGGGFLSPSAPPPSQADLTNARFGHDMAWLDPMFQQEAMLLGQSAGSQTYTDPQLQRAQYEILNANQQLAQTALNFQNPALQSGLGAQWAQIQGGAGAPQFMGNAMQQALMGQVMGQATNSGPGALAFDNGARQQEQYQNLRDIIAGGGATSIEMADRARARGDSEAWLRGQREADMADYAERGLTGSGMELQALSMDRQAAAGRNSLADLETAKALEERRLGAINSAAGLATGMRGQTIDEQGLLNSARTSGLNAATSLANSMRTQDYNERAFLDDRMTNALTQQTDLATRMREQQYLESVAGRTAQQNALDSAAGVSNQARTSQAQEAQYRATAADDFAVRNQDAINGTRDNNTQFLQNAYTNMINNRTQVDLQTFLAQLQTAQGQQNFNQRENQTASNQATNVGSWDAAAFNNAMEQLRNAMSGAANNAANQQYQSQVIGNQIIPQIGAWGGDIVGTIGSMGINAGSGASGGGGGSGGLSTPGTTWAGSAGANQGQTGSNLGFDWNEINKQLGAK